MQTQFSNIHEEPEAFCHPLVYLSYEACCCRDQRTSFLLFILYTHALLSIVRRVKQLRVCLKRFTNSHLCLPSSSDSKASTCNAGDPGRSPRGEDPLEQELAAHSSVLAWRISWTEEPGGLQSMGLQRVGHD